MAKQTNPDKPKPELSVMEAVDELTKMAEIDHRMGGGELQDREIKQEKVKETFKTLHGYLKGLYEQDKNHFDDPHTRRGIQAIMGMATEAAKKINRFTALFKGVHGEGGIEQLKEFQDLQDFYLSKILKKFEATLATEEAWEAEWGGVEVDVYDIERRGLKDLETVRRDKEYELFYIRKEDGRPFFNRNLLRHIRLVGEFDESVSDPSGDDPFLKVKAVEDGQLHSSARQLLEDSRQLIESFSKEALKYKEDFFIAGLTKSVMALMLAANPRNTIQNTMGKSSSHYFSDFQRYLREALVTQEYQRALQTPAEQIEPVTMTALYLAHKLAALLFVRRLPRNEADALFERLLEKAIQHKPLIQEGKNPLWLWNSLLDEDEKLRDRLKQYPNGPMMKTLDIMREGEEREGYDPLVQENLPYSLFTLEGGVLHTQFLHIPAPVVQMYINKVEIAEEFKAYLRGLSQKGKKEKLLLFNLENRTSWQEHARSAALEELQKIAEFTGHLVVITLPMDTDFYYQSDVYENLDDSKSFKMALLEQLASGEACGFYIPAGLLGKELTDFAEKSVDLIHELFFAKKATLTRKNRLDFIELFYLFLEAYFIEKTTPDYCSFTCKDAVDTGAVAGASFFSLVKILGNKPDWAEKDKSLLLHLLYAPAMMVRERAVDKSRLHRFVSALSLVQAEIEAHGGKLRKQCNGLFAEPIFDLLDLEAQ